MSGFLLLAALGVLLVPLVISIRRATELFVVRIRAGEAHLFRGRIPQALLDEIGERGLLDSDNADVAAAVQEFAARAIGSETVALNEAERRVELLGRGAGGEDETAPFEPGGAKGT